MNSRKKKVVCSLLALIVAGWLGSVFHQSICAHRLERLGGEVEYSQGSVVAVKFQPKSKFGDDDLPLLTRLPQLSKLRLEDTQVTDEGVARLDGMRHLVRLSVRVDQLPKKTEHKLLAEMPYLTIEKLHIIDGRKVVDGYQ